MKLSIKTKDIEIEYQDEYSKIEEEVKKRIIDVIHSLPIIPTQPLAEVTPIKIDCESFFNDPKFQKKP